jgi:hypothetical protein
MKFFNSLPNLVSLVSTKNSPFIPKDLRNFVLNSEVFLFALAITFLTPISEMIVKF